MDKDLQEIIDLLDMLRGKLHIIQKERDASSFRRRLHQMNVGNH